jgi:methylmalonyl-CoA/ethylmalonyl-CoA epimerase
MLFSEEPMDLADSQVAQILIPVEDLKRSIPFYRDTLGLKFLFEAPPQMSFFQCGAVRFLVGAHAPGEPRQHGSTIYFKVQDIQAVHRTLSERGVQFRATPHVVHRTPSYELWLAEFDDPDGNPLALMAEVPV